MLLCRIASDPTLASDIDTRSYWHPNGFAKLVIYSSADPEFRVRLHIWPKERRRSVFDEDIHDHRWPFASIALCGAVRVERFSETDISDWRAIPCERLAYDAVTTGSVGRLRHEGKTALRSQGVSEYTAGRVYFCDTSTLHAVTKIADTTTATLVVAGAAVFASALVYHRDKRDPLQDKNDRIGSNEIMRLSSEVVEVMQASGVV
jgi:hypothetical protein